MLHGTTLYGWTGKNVEVIDENAYNLYYLSDDECFYMTTEELKLGGEKIEHSVVKMLEAQFGNYKSTEIYKDKDKRAEILNFGVDNTRRDLIILSGIKN